MKSLTIKKMTIKNFKCFQEQTIHFSENTLITGDNETGKTSIYDAFCWCLFGKNSLGEKSFSCKNTLSKDGENVEVELTTQFGFREIDFKRVHEAKFTRLREFNGYATNCFINGIPKSVKDFEKEVYHILGIEMDEFNLLTNPKFLTEQIKGGKGVLDWQKRRELLYTLTEFKSDIDLVHNEKKFAQLEDVLNKYNTISEFLQAIKFDIAKINSEIELLPTRIDQQMKNIIPLDFSPAELQAEKQKLREKISTLQNNNQQKEFSENIDKLNKEIQDNLEKIELLNRNNLNYQNLQKEKFWKEKNEKKSELQKQYYDAQKEKSDAENKIQKEIDQLQLMHQQYINNIDKIKVSIEKIQKNQSALSQKSICPVCFQPLDNKEMIAENVEKQIAHLQEQKTKYENVIVQSLQKIREAEESKKMIDTSKMKNLQFQLKSLELELKNMPKIKSAESLEEQANDLRYRNTKIKLELMDIEEQESKYRHELQQEIKNCYSKIEEINQKLNIVEQNRNSESLYNELQDELDTYLSKKDDLQKKYDLASDFVQYKCEQITEAINTCFTIVKWNLFKFNKTDGELKEYCEAEINGREYKDLSMSTKIIAGLDIIQAFQKRFDIALPIFVDNAESITYFPELNAQLIKLFVQEENCPKCGSKTKRRNSNLLFQCQNCGHEFNKKLEITSENMERK